MKCNVVFEGGGVKGIAHIGALKAMEDYGIAVDKLAGTSVGALIATLIRFGYKADDLYKPGSTSNKLPQSIFKVIFPRYRDVIAPLLRILFIAAPYLLLLYFFTGPFLAFLLLTVLSIRLYGLFREKSNKTPSKYRYKYIKVLLSSISIILVLLAIIPAIIPSTFALWGFGLISTKGVEKWLTNVIDDSPLLKSSGKGKKASEITFEDLSEINNTHLKLISSDIVTREITIFSHDNDRTKGIRVIDGIIASISLPFFFKHKKIKIDGETYQFVDGGMLSNFPAWIYRKNILFDDLQSTIGILLSPQTSNSKHANDPISYLRGLINTVLWGAKRIENISVKGLCQINVAPHKVKTLQFSLDETTKKSIYQEALNKAKKELINNYSILPKMEAEDWLKNMSDMLIGTYYDFANMEAENKKGPKTCSTKERLGIRACLITPIDQSLNISKVIHQYNMEKDLDRHLEFDKREGASGICLCESIPVIYLPKIGFIKLPEGRKIQESLPYNFSMSENRKQIVKDNLKTIFSIPIFNIEELHNSSSIIFEKEDDDIGLINFTKIASSGLRPRAVLALDIEDYFLYDENNEPYLDIYRHESNDTIMSIFSFIASQAISDFSNSISKKGN